MTTSGFNFGAALAEGITACLILGLISKKKSELRMPAYLVFLISEIALVVFRYAGQENSAFFFFHPYLAFLVVDISDYSTYVRGVRPFKEAVFERFVLWPLFVIPVMSAFVMTVGWLIKLYGKRLLMI